MRKCAELRRARRELHLQRLLPGLACMGGLFGASLPLTAATYDLNDEWIDFIAKMPARDGLAS